MANTTQQAIQEELETIRSKNNGKLDPEAVVSFAKNPKTALHNRFEWDNTEAAHQWRLQQARQIIRVSVYVVETTQQTVRAYVSLMPDRANAKREEPDGEADEKPRDEGYGYRHIADVMSDEDLRQQLLAQALADMRVFRQKYATLKELVPVFDEMHRVEARASRGRGAGGRSLVAAAGASV